MSWKVKCFFLAVMTLSRGSNDYFIRVLKIEICMFVTRSSVWGLVLLLGALLVLGAVLVLSPVLFLDAILILGSQIFVLICLFCETLWSKTFLFLVLEELKWHKFLLTQLYQVKWRIEWKKSLGLGVSFHLFCKSLLLHIALESFSQKTNHP